MKYRKHFLASGLVLLVAQQLACGGSSSDSVPTADLGLVSLRDLPKRLVAAVCDNIGACCASAAIRFDLATCQLNAAARVGALLDDGKYPGVEYDPAVGASCLAAYRRLIETCTPVPNDELEACKGLFTGTLPVGRACSSAAECSKPSMSESAYCASNDNGPTICTAFSIAHAQSGDHCAGTCDTPDRCSASVPWTQICFLADGLECDLLTFQCRTRPGIGEECGGSSGTCALGAFCNENWICESLHDSGPCNNGRCSSKSYCKTVTADKTAPLECTPKEPDGTPCMSSEECRVGRCSAFDGTGTCGGQQGLATAQTCAGLFY